MRDTLLSTYHKPGLFELTGLIPIVLAFAAIALGTYAIIERRRNLNQAVIVALLGITLLGFATTAWRICGVTNILVSSGAFDYVIFFQDIRYCFLPMAVILPACAIGFLLVSFAWRFTREPDNLNNLP